MAIMAHTDTCLLVGGGHAHIGLLRRLKDKRNANDRHQAADSDQSNLEITLLSPQPYSVYSGMLPGWMAGHYKRRDICIDVAALCQQAGVRFVQGSVTGVDAASHQVLSDTAGALDYDFLSLNTGADTDMRWLGQYTDNDAVIAIRPLPAFMEKWQHILNAAAQSPRYQLAVVGAGAAAVELVMAAQVALQRIHPQHQVYLVCGETLLAGFQERFRRQVTKQLRRHRIPIIEARGCGYQDGHLLTSKESLPVDAVIAATGVVGAAWTTHTDLDTTDGGFISVTAAQQSTSHDNVFAVGDVATHVEQHVAHSGVHAVHGSKIISRNMTAYLAGLPLTRYRPRAQSLYILSCGDTFAIASWGRYSVQGRIWWYIKRYIDRRFVAAHVED